MFQPSSSGLSGNLPKNAPMIPGWQPARDPSRAGCRRAPRRIRATGRSVVDPEGGRSGVAGACSTINSLQLGSMGFTMAGALSSHRSRGQRSSNARIDQTHYGQPPSLPGGRPEPSEPCGFCGVSDGSQGENLEVAWSGPFRKDLALLEGGPLSTAVCGLRSGTPKSTSSPFNSKEHVH